MGIYLRQVCLVAEQLSPVADDLRDVFALNTAHIDPEVAHFGLENVLLAVGSQFIEIVAPTRDGTPAGRYLQRRGGDGGYMVIGQVATREEQARVRARATDHHVRVAWESDRPDWTIMQLHPGDMRAAFFEVDWQMPFGPEGHWWPAGGNGWQASASTQAVSAIAGLELQGPDPDALASHWAAIAGTDVGSENGQPIVRLENAYLRFVADTDGRGAGLGGVDIAAKDRKGIVDRARKRNLEANGNTLELGGVRFRLC